MKSNFPFALACVLQHEGGYCNDPRDPGGATNKGVTQKVYDDWRRSRGLDPRSVRVLESNEAADIYRALYWAPVRGDDLPGGVDYCIFDFAVNSGVARASRFLQQAAGVVPNGKIGPATLAAVKAIPPRLIANAVCEARLDFLRRLETFDRFGRGWTVRVAEVKAQAGTLA